MNFGRRALIAAAGLSLLLAACGGSDEPDTAADTTADAPADDTAAAGEGGTVEAEAGDELAFVPDAWTVANGEVTINFTTTGFVPHSFAVVPAGTTVESASDFDASTALIFIDIAGQESGSASATLAAGEYQVICTIPGHLEAGMSGTLTVS